MIRQLSRFASIGALATLLHVSVALTLSQMFNVTPQLSNLGGFLSAVGFSYFGHGLFTFSADLAHKLHMPRFLTVSLMGLAVSSTLTYFLVDWAGYSMILAMTVVAFAVPTSTFILCKFWVFSQSQRDVP